MNNYDHAKTVIAAIAGTTDTLVTHRCYIRFMGSHEGGQFLNQLIFYSDKNESGYFYKTHAEFAAEVVTTERTIRRYIQKIKNLGFLETKVKKANGSPTVHYKFLMDKFIEKFSLFLSQEKNLQRKKESTCPKSTNCKNDQDSVSNPMWTLCPERSGQRVQFDVDSVSNSLTIDPINRSIVITDDLSDESTDYKKEYSSAVKNQIQNQQCTCQNPLQKLNGKYLVCHKCHRLYHRNGTALPEHYQPQSQYWQSGDELATNFSQAMQEKNYLVYNRIQKKNDAWHEDWRNQFIDILRLDMPDSCKNSGTAGVIRFQQAIKEVIEYIANGKDFYIHNVIQAPAKFRQNKRGTDIPWLYQLRAECLEFKKNKSAKQSLFDDQD